MAFLFVLMFSHCHYALPYHEARQVKSALDQNKQKFLDTYRLKIERIMLMANILLSFNHRQFDHYHHFVPWLLWSMEREPIFTIFLFCHPTGDVFSADDRRYDRSLSKCGCD